MDSTVIALIVVVVVLVLALAAAGAMLMRRRRTERLREHYGPEYERSVNEAGNRRAGEAELTAREKRHSRLDIRDLHPDERDQFAASWAEIQREFVDDPKRAVRDADALVLEIMRTRGYPVGEGGDGEDDFERRAEDISVEHPDVVHRYREAHAVRDATERGSAGTAADTAADTAGTEQRRAAVTSYRSLIEALLHGDSHQHATSKERTR